MYKAIELVTERLILREFTAEDWPAVHEYASDAEVVQYMPWGPNDEQHTKEFIGRAIAEAQKTPRRQFELAVVLRGEGRLIGGCGLYIERPEHGEGVLGYCYNPRFWRRGYATEAARALIDFGFTHCGTHRVFATSDVLNVGSWRVMEKVGMRREGLLRQNKWERGRWRDTFVYAVLKDEWRGGASPLNEPGAGQPFRIEPFTMADYDEVIAFWKRQEGVGLNESDEWECMAAYLARNAGMSFVVRDGGKLIAAVLCGHEGRRGYLHHLAVAVSHRKRGIGRRLVAQCLERLRGAGIRKCNIFLFDANEEGRAFWRAVGFVPRADLKVMQKVIVR